MPERTPETAEQFVDACRSAADDITAALARALDTAALGITIGTPQPHDQTTAAAGLDGPGLAVLFRFGEHGATAVLPAASGLLPSWYNDPDPTDKSKLDTLAQELSLLLVPDSLSADEFLALPLDNLAAAIARAEPKSTASLIPITLKAEQQQGQLSLLWPLAQPGKLQQPSPAAAPPDEPAIASSIEPHTAAPPELPQYTRSLFKVRIPVSVNLAHQKQSVHDILDLVPGSIVKFDKSCDELLDLVVGDQPIAAGEVVKVGDKFGLRIRTIIQPQEQFVAIKASLSP